MDSPACPVPFQLGPLRIGDDDRLSPETSLLVEEEIKKLLKVIPPVNIEYHTQAHASLVLSLDALELRQPLVSTSHLEPYVSLQPASKFAT